MTHTDEKLPAQHCSPQAGGDEQFAVRKLQSVLGVLSSAALATVGLLTVAASQKAPQHALYHYEPWTVYHPIYIYIYI